MNLLPQLTLTPAGKNVDNLLTKASINHFNKASIIGGAAKEFKSNLFVTKPEKYTLK